MGDGRGRGAGGAQEGAARPERDAAGPVRQRHPRPGLLGREVAPGPRAGRRAGRQRQGPRRQSKPGPGLQPEHPHLVQVSTPTPPQLSRSLRVLSS